MPDDNKFTSCEEQKSVILQQDENTDDFSLVNDSKLLKP